MTAPATVVTGGIFTVSFDGWASAHQPLSYRVFLDALEVSGANTSSSRHLTDPGAAGNYVLKGRITDNLNNPTEVTQNLLVNAPQEDFSSAAAAAGLSGPNATAEARPFQDGEANLLKVAFNMNLSSTPTVTPASAG